MEWQCVDLGFFHHLGCCWNRNFSPCISQCDRCNQCDVYVLQSTCTLWFQILRKLRTICSFRTCEVHFRGAGRGQPYGFRFCESFAQFAVFGLAKCIFVVQDAGRGQPYGHFSWLAASCHRLHLLTAGAPWTPVLCKSPEFGGWTTDNRLSMASPLRWLDFSMSLCAGLSLKMQPRNDWLNWRAPCMGSEPPKWRWLHASGILRVRIWEG